MDNEKKLNVLGLIIKIGIIVPAMILSLIVMTSGVSGESDETAKQAFMESASFGGAINITLWTVMIALVLVLAFFVISLIRRPKDGIKSILGIVISALLFILFYVSGTNDTVESLGVVGDITASEGTINFVHAGIWTVVIGIAVCSILAMFMGFLMKVIKN